MGAVKLPGTVTDPEHVGAAVIPAAGGGVLPGQRLFIAEQQGLMGGKKFRLVELRGVGINADHLHEIDRII